jgi:hypothetical protein
MSLLYAIETCLRVTRVPPSRFGREAVKDPRLVHDLRRGRQPGVAVERRVRAHIAAILAAKEDKGAALCRRPGRSLGSILAPSALVGRI